MDLGGADVLADARGARPGEDDLGNGVVPAGEDDLEIATALAGAIPTDSVGVAPSRSTSIRGVAARDNRKFLNAAFLGYFVQVLRGEFCRLNLETGKIPYSCCG